MFISDKFSVGQQAIFYSIIKGVYPGNLLKKMNSFALKRFVSTLLLHTADVVSVGSNNPVQMKQNYILWLSNKYGMGIDGNDNSNRILNFQIISNIVNFFRQNPLINGSIDIDRFICGKKPISSNKIRKRKLNTTKLPTKRVKFNDANIEVKEKKKPELIVRLCDVVKYGETYKKERFMRYFYLQRRDSNESDTVDTYQNDSHNLKLFNCPKIPISSDLGRKLIDREKLCLNEELKMCRLNRIEWYLNKPIKKLPDVEYVVTFKPKKNVEDKPRDKPKCVPVKTSNFELCRPLSVKLVRLDEKLSKSTQKIVRRRKPTRTNCMKLVPAKVLDSIKMEILDSKKVLKVCLPQ